MTRPKIKISQVITPGDILLIIIILAGIIAAFAMDEIAVRMIGISVAILSAVGLFLLISQRLTDIVEPSKFDKRGTDKDVKYTMTIKKDAKATRSTVEDFNKEDISGKEIVSVGSPNFEQSDDGFRMKAGAESPQPVMEQNIGETKPEESGREVENNDYAYSDGFSGMRIKGKFKPVYQEKNHENIQKQAETIKTTSQTQPTTVSQTAKTAPVINKIADNLQAETNTNAGQDSRETVNQTTLKPEITPVDEKNISETNNNIEFDDVMPDETYVENQKQALKKKYVEKKIDIPPGLLSEPDFLIGREPRKEFEFFLSRILMIVRSITNTRTAVFLLANYSTGELVLESFVTSMPDSIKRQARYPLGNDIISQILYAAKPEILTEINPDAELDLIPYYKEAVGTVSFIGVPIFYDENVIGILCADSPHVDVYDSQTVAFLGHFTRLISMFVHNYSTKYELIQSAKTLDVVNYFNKNALLKFGPQNIIDNITDTVSTMFENSKVGVCGFNGQNGLWEIKASKNFTPDINSKAIEVEKSLVAECIRESKTIAATAEELKSRTRVFLAEKRLEEGYFVSIPIQSASAVYGAFFIEVNPVVNLSDYDLSILEIIGEHAGNAIEKLHLTEQFENSLLSDPQTGIYNHKAFLMRLEDEAERSTEFSIPLMLCLIEIDKYAAIAPDQYPDRYENAEWLVISQIKKQLKPYEIFGKLSNGTLSIIFFGKDPNQIKLWAERTRNEIANTMLDIDGHKVSVTISAGLALLEAGDTTRSLFEHAGMALEKSLQRRNSVNLYN